MKTEIIRHAPSGLFVQFFCPNSHRGLDRTAAIAILVVRYILLPNRFKTGMQEREGEGLPIWPTCAPKRGSGHKKGVGSYQVGALIAATATKVLAFFDLAPESQAVFPGGRNVKIAFGTGQIWAMRADGSGQRQLTDGFGLELDWQPLAKPQSAPTPQLWLRLWGSLAPGYRCCSIRR